MVCDEIELKFEELPISRDGEWIQARADVRATISYTYERTEGVSWAVDEIWIRADNGKVGKEAAGKLIEIVRSHPLFLPICAELYDRHDQYVSDEIREREAWDADSNWRRISEVA